MLKDILEIQPDQQDTGAAETARRERRPVLGNSMWRRLIRLGGGVLPYLAWLIPLVDRVIPKRDAITPGLRSLGMELRNDLRNDLREHMAVLQTSHVDPTPALQDQQRRLEKLEEHAAELNHSLMNLSEDQLDLADQVRAMAGWVRNASIAGLFLLVLLFILKLVQTIHGMGH